jgi:hypothetical protein
VDFGWGVRAVIRIAPERLRLVEPDLRAEYH